MPSFFMRSSAEANLAKSNPATGSRDSQSRRTSTQPRFMKYSTPSVIDSLSPPPAASALRERSAAIAAS
jgi:hypothetical protein